VAFVEDSLLSLIIEGVFDVLKFSKIVVFEIAQYRLRAKRAGIAILGETGLLFHDLLIMSSSTTPYHSNSTFNISHLLTRHVLQHQGNPFFVLSNRRVGMPELIAVKEHDCPRAHGNPRFPDFFGLPALPHASDQSALF
jgi:hypothetical protein